MARLVEPTVEYYDVWMAAHREWGPGVHEDGFGLRPDDDVSDLAAFTEWIARLDADPGQHWWIVEDGLVAGGIALRSDEDPSVERHGHIGYGIRPSFRGRGLATWALSQVLQRAVQQGIDRVILVCKPGNVASSRVIEHAGGRRERLQAEPRTDRYRIELRP